MVGFTLEKARQHTAEVLEKVNKLVTEDFVDYRTKVQAITVKLFKEMEAVKME
jgi:hypothetical protein